MPKLYPIEVYDTPDMACYVNDIRAKSAIRRGKPDGSGTKACLITYENEQFSQYGSSQAVMMNGVKVGERYSIY